MFSDVQLGLTCGRMIFHMHYIHRVSPLCVFSDVRWGLTSHRMFSHTAYKECSKVLYAHFCTNSLSHISHPQPVSVQTGHIPALHSRGRGQGACCGRHSSGVGVGRQPASPGVWPLSQEWSLPFLTGWTKKHRRCCRDYRWWCLGLSVTFKLS